jgi:hypothetical protein
MSAKDVWAEAVRLYAPKFQELVDVVGGFAMFGVTASEVQAEIARGPLGSGAADGALSTCCRC